MKFLAKAALEYHEYTNFYEYLTNFYYHPSFLNADLKIESSWY